MKMRHLTAALLAAAVLTIAWLPDVLAADMLAKAPAMTPVASAYSWTGFYVGANAGGGWGRSSTDVVFDPLPHTLVIDSAVGSASQAMNGGLGGLQAGYNWQASGFVFGLETDIQVTGQKGDSKSTGTVTTLQVCLAPCVPPPPLVTTGKLDYAQKLPWFGTMRGRVGVTPADGWLVYATGGLAFGEVTTDANFTVPAGNFCLAPCTPAPSGSAASSFSQPGPDGLWARVSKPRSAEAGAANSNISTSTSVASATVSRPRYIPSMGPLRHAARSAMRSCASA
jgi:outer membrane immunogenic protein